MLLYTTLAVDNLHQVLGMSECSLLLCYFQEQNLGMTGGLCGDKYIAMYIRHTGHTLSAWRGPRAEGADMIKGNTGEGGGGSVKHITHSLPLHSIT